MPPLRFVKKRLRRIARHAYERVTGPRKFEPIDDRPWAEEAPPVIIDWPAAVPKPFVGLVHDRDRPPYWTKYQHFLETNGIPFAHYDPSTSDWLAKAAQFDVIIWRVESPPSRLADARRKIFILEEHCNKLCFPSSFVASLYEDKIMQWELLRSLGLPAIETFYSASYEETLRFLHSAQYPLVSKTTTGSGSSGVTLLRTKRAAVAIAKRVFSVNGLPTYWPYERQHGYVLLQPLVPNDGYDLRIIVIGERTFGFYRDTPADDFRASGNAVSYNADIPKDGIEIARAVAKGLDLDFAAVDLLRRTDGALLIIEMTAFSRVVTPRQLEVDGVPGAYEPDGAGGFRFVRGRWWPQELTLYEFFTKRWLPRQ